MKSIDLNTTAIATYNRDIKPSINTKPEKENSDLLTKRLTTTKGQEVEVTYLEKDKRTAAYVLT